MNTRPLSPSALFASLVLGLSLLAASCASPSSTTPTGTGGSGTGGSGTGGSGPSCNGGQMLCNGVCTDVTTTQNCGACGKVCGSGSSCQGGACVCNSGLLNCNNSCVASDSSHCGNCTTTCSGGQVCSSTGCSTSCGTGQTQCPNGSCANTASDNANCGACGTVCSGGSSCMNSQCKCSGAGQMLCSNACVNVASDNQHCGNCTTTCGTGQQCVNNACTSTTGTGGSTTGTGGSGAGGTTGTGGSGTGGSATGTAGRGGTTGTGGSGTGGSGTGGSGTGGSGTGGRPPGYFMTKDWNVTSVDWHGCVWTGKDSTVAGSTTNFTLPTGMDYTTGKDGGPYETAGTVYNDYNAVALLGFNLNEAATGNSTQCKYNAAAATQAGPPAATIPTSATGIAVNWSEKKAPPTSFRIQIQSVDGATNPNHRWCATITDPSGPSFIPFTSFYTQCWNVGNATMSPGAQFMKGTDTIDAVVFLVPGTVANTAPFDFTIVGFAPGTSKSDAPGGTQTCGTTMGTLGSTTASMAASFQRAAVTGTDCKTYIIQNNNWGTPTSTKQIIDYTGTTFTITTPTGNSPDGMKPASFPSTYIGANGNIANGTYNTWSDSGLPKQISMMQSVMTSFTWSGGTGSKDFNATYDVWFAKTPPTAGGYDDGISGLLMVWLYKPGNRQPIGTIARTASIPDSSGGSHMWNVWVGPRNATSMGTDGASRPVVSYVAQSTLMSLSFDLKKFIDDAVSHADTNNGVTGPFSSSWYLTDVFAGFEIWSGGDSNGLKSTNFSAVVK